MSAAADTLMGVFGFKRVRCADCKNWIETRPGIGGVACQVVSEVVKADDQCPRWVARSTDGGLPPSTADLALAYPDIYGELS